MRFTLPAGLLMILSGLGAYYATDQRSWFSILNVLGGALLLVTAGAVELRRFRGFSGSHARRLLLRWLGIGSVVLGGVVGANLAGLGWRTALDLSADRHYTLSPQTLELCARFVQRGGARPLELLLIEDALLAEDVGPLLDAYDRACAGVRSRQVRSNDAPPEARRVLETIDATVLVCQAGRCEGSGYPNEQNITNALFRLFRDETTTLYFVVGHGEIDLASHAPSGHAALAEALREEGFRVEALVGAGASSVPADADVVIAAGSSRDLLAGELEALERWLEQGGRLLALLEPGRATNLESLLERWGFALPVGVVADRATSPLLEDPDPITLLVHSYDSHHPVTRELGVRMMTLWPGARPVLPARKPIPSDRLDALAYASPAAWIEPDVPAALSGRTGSEPGREAQPGAEVPLAAAGRFPRSGGEARVVVIGDVDFASNRLLDSLYNRDLVLNAAHWLAEDETQIGVRPKAWTPHQDTLTLQQTLAYFYFMAFALPEILLLLGLHAWYRQRQG